MKKIVKRKGGPLNKKIKNNIMLELTKIVENGNILGVNNQQLADRFSEKYEINIKRQLIGTYLKKIYSDIPEEDIKHTKVKLEVMFEKIFRIAQEMIARASTNKEKQIAVDLLLRAMDKFTVFLESFGIKEKVADKMELKSLNVNVNVDYLQHIQELE